MTGENASFTISNTEEKAELTIVHEPEGFEFTLSPGQDVVVETFGMEKSIVLRHSVQNGKLIIGIMPDLGFYRVLYNGQDVFEKFL